jgi:hypothetical protein
MRNTRSWTDWARLYLHVFRAIVVTVCLTLAVYAWLAHVQWLLGASVCIGIGELVECSYYLMVLNWGERSHAQQRELHNLSTTAP